MNTNECELLYISESICLHHNFLFSINLEGDHFPFLEEGIIFLYYFYQNEKGDHFPFLEGGSFSEGDYFHGPLMRTLVHAITNQ